MVVEKIDTFGGHREPVYALAHSPLSNHFYSAAGDGQVVRWQLERPDLGELMATVPASIYALAIHPTSGLLWVGQNYEGIHVINPASKSEVASLKLTSAAIFDVKFYQNDAFIALADGVMVVVDAEQLTIRKHLKATTHSARCIAVNPVERELAIGYSDHTIRIFDLRTYTLKRVIPAHTNSVFTLAYSPDFRLLLSGGRDAHLKVWDVEKEYTLQQDIVAHLFAINHVAFSQDGNRLATASMDKSIKIWDTDTFRLLKVVDKARHAGHGTSVNKLQWLGGTHLLSASDDRTISVWKLTE